MTECSAVEVLVELAFAQPALKSELFWLEPELGKYRPTTSMVIWHRLRLTGQSHEDSEEYIPFCCQEYSEAIPLGHGKL